MSEPSEVLGGVTPCTNPIRAVGRLGETVRYVCLEHALSAQVIGAKVEMLPEGAAGEPKPWQVIA